VNQQETNIKARILLYDLETEDPKYDIQEYNQLKSTFSTNNTSFKLGDIIKSTSGENYEIVSFRCNILNEEETSHIKYGAYLSQQGTSFPYNFEIHIYLKQV